MRRLRILTWHTNGSYLYYLSQAPHEFFVLSKPGCPAGYGGRCAHIPWGDNVHDLPAEFAREQQFDCILFQDEQQYQKDQFELLSPTQRALPRIYLEHDPPHEHPTDTRHLIDDPDVLLVHVTHFNALMWDSGSTPTRVIEPGVMVPDDVAWRGDLEQGLVAINHLARRGRRLGADIFSAVRKQVPLELVGLGADMLGGLCEIEHGALPAFAARYRYLFSPIRYASPSLAMIEAMMVGLPVVGLATAGMAAFVDNGYSGYIDTDVAALVEQMRELTCNPELARRLGANARRDALERFSIGRFSADWDAALRDVAGARAG